MDKPHKFKTLYRKALPLRFTYKKVEYKLLSVLERVALEKLHDEPDVDIIRIRIMRTEDINRNHSARSRHNILEDFYFIKV